VHVARATEPPLQPQLAVGAEPHEVEIVRVGLSVDQDEIGANVTVAVIVPFAAKRVVEISLG
jgi:hypothetical protein